MTLFSEAGFEYLLRWFHFLAGITWIGLLYYFNFVQGAFFAETDAATKNNATSKLVPRALWWFRWGAMFTFLTGVAMILSFGHSVPGYFSMGMARWILILMGGSLGTLMFLNVWLVIWPKQKIVIASANSVLGGGQADPGAAAAGRRGFLASRTNTLFSIPMLFFMGATQHLQNLNITKPGLGLVVFYVIVLLLELNALTGTTGPTKQPIEKVSGVITSGFVLTAVFYIIAATMM